MMISRADQENFKEALASFASGVTVVTFWDGDGRPCGMTASSFSSVSIDPLLVLICVNRDARTYEEVVDRGRFGVNILGSESTEVSNHCARPGGDKVLEQDWLAQDSDESPPVLSGAIAYLDCEIFSDTPAGTHSIIVGRVSSIGVSDEEKAEPLLYYRGTYRDLLSAQSVSA